MPNSKKIKPNVSERDQQICLMLDDGLNGAQVGEHFGISRERVRQIAVKNGRKLSRDRKITKEVRRAIMQALTKGEMRKDVARRHNVSEYTISRVVSEAGLSFRDFRTSQCEKINMLDQSGMPRDEIAKKFGISKAEVHRQAWKGRNYEHMSNKMTEYNANKQFDPDRPSGTKQQIIELWKEGLPYSKIAEILNLKSRNVVSGAINRYRHENPRWKTEITFDQKFAEAAQ